MRSRNLRLYFRIGFFFCLWNPEIISISQCFNFLLKGERYPLYNGVWRFSCAFLEQLQCNLHEALVCLQSFGGQDMGAKLTPYSLNTTREKNTECQNKNRMHPFQDEVLEGKGFAKYPYFENKSFLETPPHTEWPQS